MLDAAAYRRPHGPVDLPDDWTPAQAQAVVEVPDLLLDAVCSKYADALLQAGREDLLVEAHWPGAGASIRVVVDAPGVERPAQGPTLRLEREYL